jgi:hypothetical protein
MLEGFVAILANSNVPFESYPDVNEDGEPVRVVIVDDEYFFTFDRDGEEIIENGLHVNGFGDE